MGKKLTLSIIMPSLNEEKNIKNAIKQSFDAMNYYKIKGDIVVINDGSTDQTQKIVESIIKKNKDVRIINHEKPMGIGFSFFDGVKYADNDVVVMFPGDNENDPHDALSFFPLLDKVDIIIPFIHNNEVRNTKRRFISLIYRFIINMSFGINCNYTNGTVFYKKCLLENITLNSSGFFYQAELLIKLIRKGYLFAEVPNFLSSREGGRSKATTLKSLFKVCKDYLHLFFEIHIKRIEKIKEYQELHVKSLSYRKSKTIK
jgi:glycosyltransferase involved in cell wall biosynthesis